MPRFSPPVLGLLDRVAADVWATFAANWPYLVISVLFAAALSVYVGTERLAAALRRRKTTAIFGAVGLASSTPFCSCGTTAVTLGMIATSAPWAPIVAFLVASPLTSPSELVLSAGLLGWPFALTFFVGTILLGLAAGGITAVVERTGLLHSQARMTSSRDETSCSAASIEPCDTGASCSTGDGPQPACSSPQPALSMGPGAAAITEFRPPLLARLRMPELGRELVKVGRRMLVLFFGFTFLSYLLIETVPTAWLQSLLGGDSPLSIVWAALIGIPMYVNTEGSLPLVAGLVNDGVMGPGPAMAFLVTGAGTSIGAITGMFVIARRRVVALVIGSLLVGAIVLGAVTQLLFG